MPFITSGVKVKNFQPSVVNTSAPAPASAKNTSSSAPKKQGIFSRVATNFSESAKKRLSNAGSSVSRLRAGEQGLKSTFLQVVGEEAGFGSDIIGQGVSEAGRAGYDASVAIRAGGNAEKVGGIQGSDKKFAENIGNAFMKSPIGKNAIGALQQGMAGWNKFKEAKPVEAANIEAVVNIADLVSNFTGVGAAGEATKEVSKLAAKEVLKGASSVVRSGAKFVGGVENVAKSALESSAARTINEGVRAVGEAASGMGERTAVNLAAKQTERQAVEALPKEAQAAVKGGVLRRDAQVVLDEASPEQRALQRKMKADAMLHEDSAGLKDPAQHIGGVIGENMESLSAITKDQGDKLGTFAKELGTADVKNVQENVLKSMKETPGLEDIALTDEGKLDFSNTTLQGSKFASERASIQASFEDLLGKNGVQLHKLRQGLRAEIGGRKGAGMVFTETEKNALEAMRTGISDTLDAAHGGYKELNQAYREAVEPLTRLKTFYKSVAGAGKDILSERGALLARRLTSNATSAPELRMIFRDMDAVLSKYGKKKAVSLEKLQEFHDVLQRYYNLSKTNSFAGQVGIGLKDVPTSVTSAIGKVAAKFEEVAGMTPEVRRKAFEDLFDAITKDIPKAPAPNSGASISPLTGKPRKSFPGLDAEGKAKEAAAYAKIDSNFDEIVRKHAALPDTQKGKLLNPDDFRELVWDEKQFGPYKGTEAQKVHEPVSELANYLKDQEIAKIKTDDLVLWTAGGPGNGKGTAIKLVKPEAFKEMQFGYDSVLGNFEKSSKDIQGVLDAGGINYIPYVFRDVESAWLEGVIGRAISKGRTVPIDVYLDGMEKAWTNIQKLHAKFTGDERVIFDLIDNRVKGKVPKLVDIETIKGLDFTGLKAKYYDQLKTAAENAYANEDISKEILDGLIGGS